MRLITQFSRVRVHQRQWAIRRPAKFLAVLMVMLPASTVALAEQPPTSNPASEVVVSEAAAPEAIVSETAAEDPPSETGWAMASLYWLEEQRDYLSTKVTHSATALDSYLARDAFDSSVINASYVRINIGQEFSTGDDNDLGASVKLRLDVPNSKQRLRLFFDSDPDDLASINDRRRDNNRTERDNSDGSVAGIELRSKAVSRWHNSARLGARVGSPVDLYARVQTKRLIELPGIWQSRFIQSASYFDRDDEEDESGWLTNTRYDIYRPVGDKDIFRVSNEAQFLNNSARWEFFHGYSYYHNFNSVHSLEYSLALTANNQPNPRVDNYWARLQWRSRLYKDWLYGKVTPELSFPRERDFKDTWSLLLELEIFFSGDAS